MKTNALRAASRIAIGAIACLLVASCGKEQPNVHKLPREPKAYESIQPSLLSQSELISHLKLLSQEVTRAANADETVEFHHLEVALTPTLEALEKQAEGNADALAAIASLKDLAIKLHQAGHDSNRVMGYKLATSIASHTDKLTSELVK